MPRIPRYQQQETIPARAPAKRAPLAAGAGGFALAELADSTGNLAEVFVGEEKQREREALKVRADIARIRNRIEKEEQHYSALRLGNQVTESAVNFEADQLAKTELDAYHSMEAVDGWQTRAHDVFLKDLDDPEVSRAVEAHIAAKALSLRQSLSRHEARQRDVVAENTRQATLRSALKSAYMGSGTFQENLQTYNAAIVNDPRLGDTEKEDKLMAGQSAIATARLEGMIDRNPAAAVDLVKSGLFNDYLDAEALNRFQARAEQEQRAAERDAVAQEKERRRQAKEDLAEEQRQIGNRFVTRLADGQLTEKDITNSTLDPTGENSKQYWLGQLRDRRKKAGSDAWKTDPEVERDLLGRILDDPNMITDRVLLENLGPDGINSASLKSLRTFRENLIDDPLKTDQAKTAIASLNAAKSAKLFDDDPAENVRRWGEATDLLKKFIVNHPEEDAAEFVDKLLEKERDGFIRRIFDFLPGVEPAETSEARRQRLQTEAGVKAPAEAAYSGVNPETGKTEYFDADGNKL